MINEKIQNYNITSSIGSGGMAEVWEAVHQTFEDRKVAIKILDPVLARKGNIATRFINEAKIMAKLEHPNIVKVIDFEQRTDLLAIVMEYLQGKDLSTFIKQNGKLSKDVTLHIFNQALSAFKFAHEQGVVHRDVKPSNIFIETQSNNQVKILDFGIAKLLDNDAHATNTGAQMGTPVYMSPEQVKDSKHIDQRSDIYSLGVVLYYMLAGKPPYDSSSLSNFDIYTKIVNEPIPVLTENTEYNDIIAKATAKNPDERFKTCAEFTEALKNPVVVKTAIKPEPKAQPTENIADEKTIVEENSNIKAKVEEKKKTIVTKPQETIVNNDTEKTLIENDAETELWEQVKASNNPDQLKKYQRQYPNGKYKSEVESKIQKLNSAKVQEKAPVQKKPVEKPAINKSSTPDNSKLALILQIISGTGFLYKKINRKDKYLYLAALLYAFINLILSYGWIGPFNSVEFGLTTLVAALAVHGYGIVSFLKLKE